MSASSVDTMELWIWSCLLLRTCSHAEGVGVSNLGREACSVVLQALLPNRSAGLPTRLL